MPHFDVTPPGRRATRESLIASQQHLRRQTEIEVFAALEEAARVYGFEVGVYAQNGRVTHIALLAERTPCLVERLRVGLDDLTDAAMRLTLRLLIG